MEHWVEAYLNNKYSKENDCLYWFRKIQLEVFGRVIPEEFGVPENGNALMYAAKTISRLDPGKYGWSFTKEYKDGNAVFLSQRTTGHHIGIIALIAGEIFVVHALEDCHIVLSSLINLKQNFWKITEMATC